VTTLGEVDGYSETFELHGSRIVEMGRDERKYLVVNMRRWTLGDTSQVKNCRGRKLELPKQAGYVSS